ncbi:hypothetical protein [Streptomyces poonensis]|uniref:Uncharacterized protein n=1 Tax=Streptomyces poonensis TaxID=68255 RepID=A0A918PDF3_9ACTN|nr:hypothetical protein [Streptomyces poonensis]GGY98724.1 hypothetical protein GCM10010365_16660 [Streptomyces poonensis]
MTGRKNEHGGGYERARSPEEPGAHSGSESRPRDRTVPGTASAKEGYQPGRGTGAGKPLEGLETRERALPQPVGGEDVEEDTGSEGA